MTECTLQLKEQRK